MDNATRFLNAFAGIEKQLREINRTSNATFKQLVLEGSKKNTVVKNHKENLLEYAELRNAIVHQRGNYNEIIAQPADSAVEEMELVLKKLKVEPTALMFASSPVEYADGSHSLIQVCEMMEKLDTSKFPVYEEGKCLGLVTYKTIAIHGVLHNHPSITVKEALGEDKMQGIAFIGKNESLVNIVKLMMRNLQKGEQVYALIVTEHGKPHQKPLGIITLADMPKIIEYLQI